MYSFAVHCGFKGPQAAWKHEYSKLLAELAQEGMDFTEGIDSKGFTALVKKWFQNRAVEHGQGQYMQETNNKEDKSEQQHAEHDQDQYMQENTYVHLKENTGGGPGEGPRSTENIS